MDLLNTIMKSMTSNSSLGTLVGKTGISADSIEKAITSAIPSLLGSMTKNASTTSGAKSLLGALSQHEDDSDVSSQLEKADEDDGNKILGKIMGDGKDDFISSIAKKAGINVGQSNQLLSTIAPALLSTISSAAKPSTAEEASESADDTSKAAEDVEKRATSLVGGLFDKILKRGDKDDDDDQDEKKSDSGFDGSDLLDILKKTVL